MMVATGQIGAKTAHLLRLIIRAQEEGILESPWEGTGYMLQTTFKETERHNTPSKGEIGRNLRILSLKGYPIEVLREYNKNGKGTLSIYRIGRIRDAI